MELKKDKNQRLENFFKRKFHKKKEFFVEDKNLNKKETQEKGTEEIKTEAEVIIEPKKEIKVEKEKKKIEFKKFNDKKKIPKSNEVVVSVESLKKNFIVGQNDIEVLRGIDIEIKKGDFAMLVGPSGCGKSTLLHVIYGLEAPTEGKVFIKGDNIWSHNKNWRADFRNSSVGFIPQQAFWLKSLSVLENVAMPAVIGGKKFYQGLERAAEMLEMVGMSDWANHRPYDLSGGQQQRIALARALLLDPWFIIADEPTGNLDQKSGIELMNLIKEFNQYLGLTILMVTHNQEQFKYSNKVIKVVDGRIVQE